jgi:hypothetical protein
MQHIPEPELMTDPAQAQAYAEADFSAPHDAFVAHFAARFPDFKTGSVLDLGWGMRRSRKPTARIALRCAARGCQIQAWRIMHSTRSSAIVCCIIYQYPMSCGKPSGTLQSQVRQCA